MTKPKVTEKVFNPTVGAFFDAPEFGQDATETTPDSLVIAVTTRSGKNFKKELGTAFTSAPINEEGFKNIQKHIQIGSKLLLRKAKNPNKNGGRTFYLEVLPELNNTVRKNVNVAPESDI